MTIKNCADCEAFLEIPGSPNRAGICRAVPPVPVVYRYVSQQVPDPATSAVVTVLNGLIDSYFPPTRADLGCLGWMQREVSADDTVDVAIITGPVNGTGEAAPVDEPVSEPVAGLAPVTAH